MSNSNIITSRSEKKNAMIIYTIGGGYRSVITQVVNNGLEIENDFIQVKDGFKTYESAVKWSLKNIN